MLKIVAITASVVVGLVVAFIIWRWMSVARGAWQRDEKLLARFAPIGEKLKAGQAVPPGEIEALAARPEMRCVIFPVLRQMQRTDLMPSGYSSTLAQGESALAYWMMHPNELQDAPERIELVETLNRTVDGQEAEFHVYRYRMPAGHWAAKDGWILGLAGPMKPGAEPYAEMPGAFSRAGDVEGKVKPAELVDWYVGMARQKGLVK